MNGVALRILLGDRAKYIGLIFGIAFSTMLMSNQISIFAGLMLRTAGQILDAREADIWVMDPRVEYVDEIEPMTDMQLGRVRGVDGVDWAVPFFKGLTVAHTRDGMLQQIILLGVDDGDIDRRRATAGAGFGREPEAARRDDHRPGRVPVHVAGRRAKTRESG
jgi:putative ABC transport system permease protein